MLFNSKFLKIT